MKYAIFQINLERDVFHVAFAPHCSLQERQGTDRIDSFLYDHVYEGETDSNSLEDLFVQLNTNPPKDYACRPLSMSDVIKVSQLDGTPASYYYVDGFGFRTVGFEEEHCVNCTSLSAQLLEKLHHEQADYLRNLLAGSKHDILRSSYEIAMREDVLNVLDSNVDMLTEEQVKALLEHETLKTITEDYIERDSSDYMESVLSSIETTVNNRRAREENLIEWLGQ